MKLQFRKTKKNESDGEPEDTRREKTVRMAVSAQNIQKALQHWRWRLLNMRLRDSVTRLSLVALIAAGAWGTARAAEPAASTTSNADAPRDGYFLSLDQKAELLNHGRITGADGTRYDVRLVPGYVPSVSDAGEHFRSAADQFTALPEGWNDDITDARKHLASAADTYDNYADTEHYKAIADTCKEGTEFIAEDVATEFVYEGIRDEWTTSMSRAAETTRRQVIGWPLAFPWSLTKSTVETAGRLTLGTAGIAGGAAASYAVIPVAQMLAPAGVGTAEAVGGGMILPTVKMTGRTVIATVAGTTEAAGGGVAVPVVKSAWNTAVAPPIALAGRVPNQDRADGYFVKIMPAENAAPAPATDEASAPLASRASSVTVISAPVPPSDDDEVSVMVAELASPAPRADADSDPLAEAGCCAIFNEMFRLQAAFAVLDARASIPQM